MEGKTVRTLATVKGVDEYMWDPLGEVLFVELIVGPSDSSHHLPVTMTPEGAESLLRALQESLEERPGADEQATH